MTAVRRFALIASLALAGLAAAVAMTFPPSANAWDWRHPPAGYSTSAVEADRGSQPCFDVTVDGRSFGSTCDGDFQSRFDAYVDSTICTVNPDAGKDAGLCGTTSTSTPSTTDAASTTTTAATDTTASTATPTTTAPPTDSTPTTTTTQSAPATTTTTTVASPSSPPPTTTAATVTVAATTTTTATDSTTTTTTATDTADLASRIATLEQEYADLASRVDALAKANTASWDAFRNALNTGSTIADAALAARSAGLNAMYELSA